MAEANTDLERRIERLEERLLAIELRLSAAPPHTAAPRPVTAPLPAPRATHEERADVPLISLTGRSLIAIGGAYLLRALTESAVLPRAAGLALGLAYAGAWVYVALRHAALTQRRAATFASAVAAMVGFPLIWEATARFQNFSIETAATAMLALSLALVALAARHDLPAVGWIACSATFACTAALIAATEQVALPLVALSLSGALLWHSAGSRNWWLLRWAAVLGAWAIAIPTEIAVAANRVSEPREHVTFALLLVAFAYLGSIAAKNLLGRARVEIVDIVQAIGTTAFVLAGAAVLASAQPGLAPGFALALGSAAVAAYVTALSQPAGDPLAGHYFAAVGLVFVLAASLLRFGTATAGVVWIGLAVAIAAGPAAARPAALRMQAPVYALASGIGTGLLAAALTAVTGFGTPRAVTAAMIASGAGICLATAAVLLRKADLGRPGGIAGIAFASLAILVVLGAVARLASSTIANDAAAAAAVRSTVIAGGAVAVALLARTGVLAQLSPLVYPILGIGAAKFIVDDVMGGRAATLFVALAVYGSALLVLARLRRPSTV